MKRRLSVRKDYNKLASVESFMRGKGASFMEDDFVIKEEVKEEDKVSNLNSDSIPEYSPLKFSGMVQEGPTPTSGSGSNTSKHL